MAKRSRSEGKVTPLPPGSKVLGRLRLPAATRGQIKLWAPETETMVTGRYSEPPQVVAERAANGAWTSIPRQQLRPLSSWNGHQPVKVQCKIRLDGWDDHRSVAWDLRQLRELEERLPGEDAERRPPYVKLIGYTPGHYGDVRWVIDDLQVVEELHDLGVCMRALVTVTLMEWVTPQIAVRVSATRSKAKSYTWRKGDTLAKVAKRKLGSSGDQAKKAIRDANPAIKAWTKVPVGQKIKIPSSTVVAA